jgi:beta-lactamase class A
VRAPEGCLRRRVWLAACVAGCAWLLAPGASTADEARPGGAPGFEVPGQVETAPADAAPLWEWRDPKLQLELEVAMAKLGLAPALARRMLAVALVDITRIERPRVSAINGDRMFYAASLPKIAVMLAVFAKAESGELEIDEETRAQLYRMIRASSNPDSTALMRKVGKEYIAEVLRSPRYRLYDTSHNGGLWAGKDYAGGGLWQRDPIHNFSHGATVMQVARFFFLLEKGELVSREASREMKQILMREGTGRKFLKGFRQVRPDAAIYRKGGTWHNFHADGALVERRDGAAYIAVALTESASGKEWLTQIAMAMDGLIAPPRTSAGR